MAIEFSEIDQQAVSLKKARAILSLVTDTLPATDENEDCAWAITTAHNIIHDVIEALDKAVNSQLQAQRTEHAKV